LWSVSRVVTQGQDIRLSFCSYHDSTFIVRHHDTNSTVQYSIVQYSTVQYSTVQYSTVQYSTLQYNILLNKMGSENIWSDIQNYAF